MLVALVVGGTPVLAWPLGAGTGSAGASSGQVVVIVPKTAPQKVKLEGVPRQAAAMPFYVYNNSVTPAIRNFVPSGYMGDVGDLRVMGSYTNVHQEGYPSLKVQYLAVGEMAWAGLVWQNPANNWGEQDGGYNLSNARRLSFWAKGETGGEVVEFKLGGMASKHPDSDSISTGNVTLKNEWTRYSLDLGAGNLVYISAGFGFVVKQDADPNGCTFYLDDIRYEE